MMDISHTNSDFVFTDSDCLGEDIQKFSRSCATLLIQFLYTHDDAGFSVPPQTENAKTVANQMPKILGSSAGN